MEITTLQIVLVFIVPVSQVWDQSSMNFSFTVR